MMLDKFIIKYIHIYTYTHMCPTHFEKIIANELKVYSQMKLWVATFY